jgi:hypothetical protein
MEKIDQKFDRKLLAKILSFPTMIYLKDGRLLLLISSIDFFAKMHLKGWVKTE